MSKKHKQVRPRYSLPKHTSLLEKLQDASRLKKEQMPLATQIPAIVTAVSNALMSIATKDGEHVAVRARSTIGWAVLVMENMQDSRLADEVLFLLGSETGIGGNSCFIFNKTPFTCHIFITWNPMYETPLDHFNDIGHKNTGINYDAESDKMRPRWIYIGKAGDVMYNENGPTE